MIELLVLRRHDASCPYLINTPICAYVQVEPFSQEKNIRNFFIKSMAYLFNIAEIKDIVLSNVKRLVLVDTRQPDRIGRLSSLLKISDLEIHIYDHHPDMANDIKMMGRLKLKFRNVD